MSKECFIGVDCSTQSTKAVLFDVQGNVLREARWSYQFSSPHNGWAEQDAGKLWEALCDTLKTLNNDLPARHILGIAIAYQRETFVLLDKAGNVLRPAILWLDQRSLNEVREIEQDIGGEQFQRITGKILNTLPSLPKLKWIQNNEPDIYAQCDKFCDVGAYINYRLTGAVTSPFSGADTTGLFELQKRDWSDDLLDYVGLSRKNMPEVVPAGECVGVLKASTAVQTGLPEGLPVYAAGGDGQVFAVGTGSLSRDTVALSLGTSVVWGVHGSTYRTSSHFRTMMSCQPGTYYFESAIIAGSQTVKWFVDNMGAGESAEARAQNTQPETLFEDKIRDIDPGCEGLITLPYWRGVMNPYNSPGARGATLGWSDYHTRYHFYRSILEGIAFELHSVMTGYEETLQVRPRTISIGSGGARSTVWPQIISDVTGMGVEISESFENTALGAAMNAAWGAGMYRDLAEASRAMSRVAMHIEPHKKNNTLYSRLYNDVYKHVFPAAEPYLVTLGSFGLNRK
jgi:xylulokinase